MKLYVQTWGCQMNQLDSARIVQLMKSADYEPTDRVDEADLIILNTCSVRDKAEQKVYSALGRWRQLKEEKGVILGVGGCVAQQEGEKLLRRAPHLDLVFGTHNMHKLPQMVEEAREAARRSVETAFYRDPFYLEDPSGLPETDGAKAYVTIMQYAIFPAILFFLGIFVTVDREAKKLRLKGLASDELPDWKSQVTKYLHLLVPIGLLVWLIVQNRSLMYSITVSIIALFVLAYLRSATRMGWGALFDALVASSRDILGVAMATAAVGIIVGIVGLTGLGIKLSSLMVDLSVGNLLASLLLAFLGAMVLGMTMNTSAVYLLLVALIIPGLLKVGLSVPQAHFFGFYFGVLAQVTPPVAVTAYAAAGLAQADLNKTGYAAIKLCASGFVVPFMFAYSPELMLIGSWQDIAIAIPSALIGVYVVSVVASAYWLTHMRWYERLVALGGALLSIFPGIWSDIIGLALIALVLAGQFKRVRMHRHDLDAGVTK